MASPVSPFPAARAPAPAASTSVSGQSARADAMAQGVQARFKPGIDTPRVKAEAPVQNRPPPHEPVRPQASSGQSAAPPSNNGNRQFFTLQALSAYAGMIIGEDLPQGSQAHPTSAAGASATADGEKPPPPRPGSLFDLKV